MKYALLGVCAFAALGVSAVSASAQQNIMQTCGAEWQAAKEGGKLAAGATWNDFLSQCRTRHATPAAATTPAAAPAPAAAAAPSDNTNVMRQCGSEWQAAKEGGKLAAGATWNDFLAQCRTRHATPAAAQAAPAVQPKPAAPARPAPAPAAATAPAKATSGFASEGQAQATCPTDMVVWVNEKSDVYHFKGARYFGATKSGGYMCEKEALRQGNHAAKDEKRPQQ